MGALAVIAAPAAAGATEKPGSVHLQCDGQPATQTMAETIGLLTAVVATGGIVGGIVGAPEGPDSSKQQKGDAAAEACEAAIAKDTSETRRVQLKLAKAVHRIESGRDAEALTEVRNVASVAPKLVEETYYRRSLALSAMEIEAAALVRLGKLAEAEQLAMRMYEASPYDLANLLRIARFAQLTPEMTPAKRAYWDGASRQYPALLSQRAEADEWAGDFAGAAADLEALTAVIRGFMADPEAPMLPDILARISVDKLLAGDLAGSEAAAVAARRAIDDAVSNNKLADEASKGQELLDLQAIGRMAAQGQTAEARRAFAARSRWLAPSAPVVAELTRRLREGAAPAELTGALARDPAKIRTEGLQGKAKGLADNKDLARYLLSGRRVQKDWVQNQARSVWNVTKSPYVLKKKASDTYKGDGLFFYGASDIEGINVAFTLHAALLAQAKGKTHFVFAPHIRKLDVAMVRYGNLGDPDMPERGAIEAGKVVAELSPRIPKPAPRK